MDTIVLQNHRSETFILYGGRDSIQQQWRDPHHEYYTPEI